MKNMNVIKQSDDEFIVELGYRKAHWWENLYTSIRWWIRDTRYKCAKCEYYNYENNTCQSKKCCTGLEGYVTWFDKLFCKPKE